MSSLTYTLGCDRGTLVVPVCTTLDTYGNPRRGLLVEGANEALRFERFQYGERGDILRQLRLQGCRVASTEIEVTPGQFRKLVAIDRRHRQGIATAGRSLLAKVATVAGPDDFTGFAVRFAFGMTRPDDTVDGLHATADGFLMVHEAGQPRERWGVLHLMGCADLVARLDTVLSAARATDAESSALFARMGLMTGIRIAEAF